METISEIKQLAVEKKENSIQEEINKKDVEKAIQFISHMELSTPEDYCLFFASINLLNRYSKTIEEPDYWFKSFINLGLDSIIYNEVEGVTFNYNKDGAVLINTGGLQFSFHTSDKSEKMIKAIEEKHFTYNPEEWQGIRLQPCATSVFNESLSLKNLTQKTLIDKTVEQISNQVDEKYQSGITK
jgi:hypothetical protein